MSIGSPGPFALLKRVWRPRSVPLDVWLAASVPKWEYSKETGPYRLVCASLDGRRIFVFEQSDDVAPLLDLFVEICTPFVGRVAALTDGRNQVLIGWTYLGAPAWIGCEVGFRKLAEAGHDVDAALWEASAKAEREGVPIWTT